MILATLIIKKFTPRDTAYSTLEEPPRRRNELDHFKYFLITLVVIHHMGPRLNSNAMWSALGRFTIFIGLSGFVLISGYNGYSAKLVPRRMQKVLKLGICYYWRQGLTILYWFYIVIPTYEGTQCKEDAKNQLLWMIPDYSFALNHKSSESFRMDLETFLKILFLTPLRTLWYLQCLVGWLLALPY